MTFTRTWTDEAILQKASELKSRREPRNVYYVQKRHRDLFEAAQRSERFKGWEGVIEAGGEDYSSVKKRDFNREVWTDDLVIYEILRLYNANVDLSSTHIEEIYPSFLGSVGHKRSWKEWIELAGLDYTKIARIHRLTQEEKLQLFFDYLAMDGKGGAAKQLAEKYSIGHNTAKRNLCAMRRRYLGDNVELSDDFKKRFYNYTIEETKTRGGFHTLCDLEMKILSRCGYEIIKEGTTTTLRKKHL